jgi:hypothetical protein
VFDDDRNFAGFATNPPVTTFAESRNFEDAAAVALSTIQKTFEYGMILLFRGGELRPWKWAGSFIPTSPQISAINLDKPSVFRIAYRTSLPYHGYVVTSEVNAQFFNEWLSGMLPKHLTLVPILLDGQMAGMILGITNGTIAYKSSLGMMENLAGDLAQTFIRLQARAKAA